MPSKNRNDQQLRRPSKQGVPIDKLLPPSDVSPHAAKGGDKESNEPLPRPMKGGESAPSRGSKPKR
jgi:hypothetical protein